MVAGFQVSTGGRIWVFTEAVADDLVRWYGRYFNAQRLQTIPDDLRASAAVRATWSIGRVAAQIDEVLCELPDAGSRDEKLQRLRMVLAKIAHRGSLPFRIRSSRMRSRRTSSRGRS